MRTAALLKQCRDKGFVSLCADDMEHLRKAGLPRWRFTVRRPSKHTPRGFFDVDREGYTLSEFTAAWAEHKGERVVCAPMWHYRGQRRPPRPVRVR